MTDLVPRTVTELGEDGSPVEGRPVPDNDFGWSDVLTGDDSTDWVKVLAGRDPGARPGDSLTLEDFRECDAYVLLGAPGAGKTTLFESEGGREGCHCVTARRFVALRIEQLPPDWRDTTLFIDGLDEKRAGSVDGRTPLDDIWARLEALGRPRFRLSCREADWFGSNDRSHLETASKNGNVKVLRLDPLSDDGIRELLSCRADIDDAAAFMEEARERRIEHLLANPKNLEMLADAVSGGAWPETRMQTFELACEKLAQEFNRDHQIASINRPATTEVLDTAGHLCAVQLLSGAAGYDDASDGDDSEYLGLESIPGNDRARLRLALRSRLFAASNEEVSTVEGRSIPVHRQVGEFLAARYLANLIDTGLPVRRALALLTGEDGGVVSELRGLAAWLAVHCLRARQELIERDPEGVAAYGDSGSFTRDEKRRLLECLCPVDPSLDASLFTSLVTSDMVSVLLDLLDDPTEESEHRSLVLFVLCVLANASPVPELAHVLFHLAASEERPAVSRQWAATCLAQGACEQPEPFGSVVRCLLSCLREDRIRDEGKSMLGRLLQILYPKFIGPDEVFDYLDEDHERNRYIGDPLSPYDVFWRHDLARESRPEDLVVVLKALEESFERSEEWRQTGEPPASPLVHPAGVLVRKALEQTDGRDLERSLRWLRLASGDDWGLSQNSTAIRGWIEAEPERFKALLRESVAQCVQSGNFDERKLRVKRPLHGASPPSDHGRWCLAQIDQVGFDEELAKFWFEEAWYALLRGNGADGLTLEHLEHAAARNPSLASVFDDLRSTDINSPIAKMQREERQRDLERRQSSDQRFAEWRQVFIRYEEALRENRCPAGRLNTIAEVYLGLYMDIGGDDGRERLREFLGECALVEAAMDGLQGAIHRDDLPTPEEVLALRVENQRHLLAFPVVAGLELLVADSISALDDPRARAAIASFLASPPLSPQPTWIKTLFASRPSIAAKEVVRFAAMSLRRGERHVSFVNEMLNDESLSAVNRVACPKLLRAFPVRAPQHLHGLLKRLLWWGISNLDASTVESVVTGKLGATSMTRAQRGYWLAAQLVVSNDGSLAAIEDFAGKQTKAMAGFFAFFERSPIQKFLLDRLPPPSLSRLARLLGAVRRPLGAVDAKPAQFRESDFVHSLIKALGSRTDDDALSALALLGDDPDMAFWRPAIRRLQQEQRVLRRDARYRPPGVKAVLQTLECGKPANAADLAALTFDFISEISNNVRHGNTSDWRQYWARPDRRHQESWEPSHEDDCRDALLSDLQTRLHALGVHAAPEGRYADEKRSDICVSFGGFNVPVEVKKSSHRDLWSAIRNQLIAKYTRDPGANGYGIYLVFWFGGEHCRPPESGPPPRSAAEFEERLRDTLTPEEARLISICVIDVSRP